MTPLLEARTITKTYAGLAVLSQVDLVVGAGERVGLIGPNGAGKTTLFNCLLGVTPADRGQVELDGEDISGLSVAERCRRGMGRTFQRIELFGGCTVREHLLIAERTRRRSGRLWKDLIGLGRPKADEIAACDVVLDQLGLLELADEPIEHLSLGQGRLVEVGRALMIRPRLLLLDEPSSGLDRNETRDLARTLLAVQAEQGFAILLVEHDVELVSAFTERCYVLDYGSVIAEGPTAEVLASPEVRAAYLGTRGCRMTAVLEMEGVWAGYGPFHALFDVSLTVEPGSAVALLGPNGAGKTTLARVASGLVAPERGRVRVGGTDLTGAAAHRFARAGVAHAVEGRSVFASLSVEENLRLSFRRTRGARGTVAALEEAYERFPVLAQRRDLPAGQLSGGQQRMLSIARVVVEAPPLLIADELSLGLAPIVVDDVYAHLRRLRDAGTALLIVEQQVHHALALCDGAVLLDHGSITWQGAPDEAAEMIATRLFDHDAADDDGEDSDADSDVGDGVSVSGPARP